MIEFKLDPRSGVPFYKQIVDQIRFGISSGSLKVGEQLPTVRSLAVLLKVNLNTISKAYKELEIQNVLETQQGTGTFIGTIPPRIDSDELESKLSNICSEFLSITSSYGFKIDEVINELKKKKGGSK
ncbi:MAG: GntR family transcriptional regulator [Ignavibacteriales bacterium]|nr:GntR family transcriptional regulator [Ignavibacteriales bacterium]